MSVARHEIGMTAPMLRRAAPAILAGLLPHFASGQDMPDEVQVGTAAIIDAEFDWARDGVYCPACNFGTSNSRFSYIDNENNLWVARVDFDTGAFVPFDGRGMLVDTNATAPREIGNGPEWAFSTRGSELVYNRWTDGVPRRISSLNLAFARMGEGAWVAGIVPETQTLVLPVGSMDPDDTVPSVHYQSFSTGTLIGNIFWRDILPSSTPHQLPIESRDPAMTRRWVPGTRDIIIAAPANADSARPDAVVHKQVFLYRTTTGVLEQLTFDPVDKLWAFMWQAPEFDGEHVFFVVVGGNRLNVYRNMPRPDGTARWRVVSSIGMPEAMPYINSPEPFVHNGRSWIFFTLSANPDLHDYTATTQLAITGIAPDTSSVRMLTSSVDPPRARKDPEHFITANGPYIYYNRYVPATDTTPQINEGVFRVDTGLGPSAAGVQRTTGTENDKAR